MVWRFWCGWLSRIWPCARDLMVWGVATVCDARQNEVTGGFSRGLEKIELPQHKRLCEIWWRVSMWPGNLGCPSQSTGNPMEMAFFRFSHPLSLMYSYLFPPGLGLS